MRRTGWGPIAFTAALAACSPRASTELPASAGSSAPPVADTSATAPVADTAATAPVADTTVADTAAAPVADTACLPLGTSPAVAVDGDGARLCWSSSGGDDPDLCLWMSRDGKARRGPAPAPPASPPFPRVTIVDGAGQPADEGPGSAALVCAAAGACRTITPRGATDAVVDAVLDAAAARVAILVQADPLDGGAVHIHDVRTGKRLALDRMAWDDHHGVSYRIAWVGRFLLWVEQPGATAAAHGALYAVAGGKLRQVASVADRVYEHAVGARHVAFTGTALAAEVHDVVTGRAARTIDLAALYDAGPDAYWEENDGLGPSLAVDGDAAVFWLAVDDRLRLAVASLARGAATFVEVPRCPRAAAAAARPPSAP